MATNINTIFESEIENDVANVTDESSPSSAGSMAHPQKKVKFDVEDDKFTKIENKFITTMEVAIEQAKKNDENETDHNINEYSEENDVQKSKQIEDIIHFLCTRCNTKRPIKLHCFECIGCSSDNCKECWPDCIY